MRPQLNGFNCCCCWCCCRLPDVAVAAGGSAAFAKQQQQKQQRRNAHNTVQRTRKESTVRERERECKRAKSASSQCGGDAARRVRGAERERKKSWTQREESARDALRVLCTYIAATTAKVITHNTKHSRDTSIILHSIPFVNNNKYLFVYEIWSCNLIRLFA